MIQGCLAAALPFLSMWCLNRSWSVAPGTSHVIPNSVMEEWGLYTLLSALVLGVAAIVAGWWSATKNIRAANAWMAWLGLFLGAMGLVGTVVVCVLTF